MKIFRVGIKPTAFLTEDGSVVTTLSKEEFDKIESETLYVSASTESDAKSIGMALLLNQAEDTLVSREGEDEYKVKLYSSKYEKPPYPMAVVKVFIEESF